MNSGVPETGLIVFAKRECETCAMVEPVFRQLQASGLPIVVFTQDDPAFPTSPAAVDDTALERSFHFDVETVPTLIRIENGREVERTFGWSRTDWERVSGSRGLGPDLPAMRPGCGSKTREPNVWEQLVARFGDSGHQVASDRRRRMGRRDRSLLRARMVGRLAGRAADRRAHPADAGGYHAQAR